MSDPANEGQLSFEAVPGLKAIERLIELRGNQGTVPFIAGEPRRSPAFGSLKTTALESILREAESLNVSDWFRSRLHQQSIFLSGSKTSVGLIGRVRFLTSRMQSFNSFLGRWPIDGLPKQELTAHLDIRTNWPLETVNIGVVHAADWTTVPAVLGYGGWNDCPEPAAHVAVMRYWRDRYGARIASMTDDVVEFTVDAPPSTQQQAYALAWEQYAYCADIVDQGTQTLSNLAAGLIDADAWFFWWD